MPRAETLDALPQFAWLADADGRVTFVNAAGKAYLGEAADGLWHRWVHSVHPGDRDTALRWWARAVRTGGEHTVALRIRRASDRTHRWHEVRARAETADGAVTGWSGTMTDIEAARDMAERFRTLFETDLLGMFFWDFEGKIGEANEAFLRIVGRTREDLEAGTIDWRAMTPPEFREADADAVEQVRREGRCDPFEKQYLRPDGTRVPVLLGGAAFDAGGGVAFIADLSARRRSEEALAEMTDLRRLALDASDLGTYDFDLTTGEIHWDARCRTFFGVTAPGAVGLEEVLAKVHPDDLPRVRAAIAAVLDPAGDGHYDIEYRTVPAPGEVRWVGILGRVSFTEDAPSPDRRPVRWVGVIGDITERREAVERLRRSEAEYRATFEVAAVGKAENDIAEGRFLRVNRRFARMLGYEPDELIGRRFAEITHPDHVGESRGQFRRLVAGEIDAFEIEKRYLRRDGSTFWGLVTASVLRDEDGTPRRGMVVVQDINQRHAAREALKRSEAAATLLADAGRELSSGGEPDEILARVTRVAIREFADWADVHLTDESDPGGAAGRPARSTADRTRLVYVAHRDPDRVALVHRLRERYPPRDDDPAGVVHVARTGESETADVTDDLLAAVARDDEHLRILRELGLRSYICVPLTVGTRVLGAMTFVTDAGGRSYGPKDLEVATELARRAAQAVENARLQRALADSERRFRGTFQNAGVGIAHVGLDGSWLRVNQKLCDIVGYTEPELRGLTFQDITHPEDLDADQELYDRLTAGEIEDYRLRKRYFHRDGRTVWIRLSVAVQRDAAGTPLYGISVIEDISGRVADEERLRELNATLEQRVADRTRKVRRQNRELKRLARELSAAEHRERRRLAHALHDNLQQILVVARMSAVRAASDSPAAGGPLAEVVGLVDEAINESRTLTYDLVPPVLYDRGLGPALDWLRRNFRDRFQFAVEVHADGDAEPRDAELGAFLFQSARELLFNAVKHSGARAAKISLVRLGPRELSLTVSDDGRGTDADGLRPDAADDDHFGLFGIRQRLRLLGGDLIIDTAPARGFSALMTAPDWDTPQQEVAVQTLDADIPDGVRPRLRVMIVDDHRIVRAGIAGLLRTTEGIEVVGEASDGQEAVDLVESLRPDAIVMDVTMPRMDGIEATRRVCARLPGVRVVGLSMHTREDMAEAMCDAGAESFVTKGGPPDQLISAIRGEALDDAEYL